MQVWLKLWRFLDESEDLGSLSDISKASGISYPSILETVRMFEEIGYVTVVMKANKKTLLKTKMWFASRTNLNKIYDSLVEDSKK